MGRIGGMTMPFVSIYGSTQFNILFPYVSYCAAGILSFLALTLVDYET
jgi:hypothetical protein